MITARNIIFKRRQQTILNGVSMALHRGEVVALVGANGVGKTTLFHILAGYIEPTSGAVERDCPISSIALLADKPALYPDWSVNEVLQRTAELRGLDLAKVSDLIDEFGLHCVRQHAAKQLSHGYRQRLAMAQMLLFQPQVMMLDEPSNGLDYRQKRALWPLLARLKLRGGVLLISHDWAEVAAVADRVYVLKGGQCHVIELPSRKEHWRWLSCVDASAAQQVCEGAACIDGRFVAVEHGQVYDVPLVCEVSAHYPAQALQEKIDALA